MRIDAGVPALVRMMKSDDSHLSLKLLPTRTELQPGEILPCLVRVTNKGAEPVVLTGVAITCPLRGVEMPSAHYRNRTTLQPGEIHVLKLAASLPTAGLEPGPVPLSATVKYAVGTKRTRLSDTAVVKIPKPVEPEEPPEEKVEEEPAEEPEEQPAPEPDAEAAEPEAEG